MLFCNTLYLQLPQLHIIASHVYQLLGGFKMENSMNSFGKKKSIDEVSELHCVSNIRQYSRRIKQTGEVKPFDYQHKL